MDTIQESLESRSIFRAIDTHCHPQMRQFDADRDVIIRRALDAGIGMVCVGVDLETSRAAVALARSYEGVYASVGLHPNDNLGEEYDQSEYLALAGNPKAVAVGEIGLDYYRTTDPDAQEFQKKRFMMQLGMAKETGKPVIIHCRDAHADMRELLRAHGPVEGVVHSFTGTTEDAFQYIELGLHIGCNGIITFARQYDEAIRSVPDERLLLETDAPYLAPRSQRGKRNEPVHILETAHMLAELRGGTLESVLAQTTRNAAHLFRLE